MASDAVLFQMLIDVCEVFRIQIRKMPLTYTQQLRRAFFDSLFHSYSQFTDLRLSVFVITQSEEIGEVGSCHNHLDVGERFQDPIYDLLVGTQSHHSSGVLNRRISGSFPKQLSLQLVSIFQLFTGLHTSLVFTPVDRHGRIVDYGLDHLHYRNSTAGAGITAEYTVGHELRVDESGIFQLKSGDSDFAMLANTVTDHLSSDSHWHWLLI